MPESVIGYYDLLNISRDATIDEIKKAFRELAHKFHPDKNKGDKESEKKFKEICQAYEVLKDPQARMMYDMTGNAGANAFNSRSPFSAGFKGFPGGMGRKCGRGRGCGRRFRNNFYGQFFDNTIKFHEISITGKEAANGTVISVKPNVAGAARTYNIRLPQGIENGTLVRYIDEETAKEIYIKINVKHND